MTRRTVLSGAGALALWPAGAAWANAPERSLRPVPRPRIDAPPALDDILAETRLTGAVSLAAVDLATGRLIESRNGHAARGLPPASVMKALTAAYALDVLGEGFRYETRLMRTGPIEDGVLKGDLILAGSGDPTLDTRRLDRLAAALGEAGVSRIEGRFLIWDAALPLVLEIDPEQDDHLGYNAALSGVNLNFNRVHFGWSRANGTYSVTLDARAGDLMPAVTSARMRIEDRRAPVYTYEDADGRDDWTVARRALGQGGARWLPVRNPARYAGDVFVTLARRHGVSVPVAEAAETEPEGEVMATDRSAPLPDIVRGMLRFSTNITAEALGVTASLARGPLGDGPPLVASGAAMADWAEARLGLRRALLIDHSGLGDESRIGAGGFADAIRRLALAGRRGDIPEVIPLMRPFAMPNAAGELAPDGPIRVAAKTGTLNFVSGLSGVATGPRGGEVAFAIFMANLPERARGLASGDEIPDGARPWNRRAKAAQRALIERWVGLADGG